MSSWNRRANGIAIGVAVAIAAYTGLRMPNLWSATLDSVSLFGGFHRRILVGTLLYPLAVATDYSYVVFATFSFLVLAALLAVLVVAAFRAESIVQRLWVTAWFLLPTGGFLFNEVGYFDQLIYLMLFVAIWLVHRGRLVPATVLMSLTPFAHEIAIVTVIPIFGLVVLRSVPFRRAAIATGIPLLLGAVVMVIPPASDVAVEHLMTTLKGADFPFRIDALLVFQRTQGDNWGLYSVHDIVIHVFPTTIVLLAAFLVLWFCDRDGWLKRDEPQRAWVVLLASAAAIAIPYLLVFGGWDGNRWLFLVISNFFIVVWLSLRYRPHGAVRGTMVTTLVITALLVSRVQIWYFERISPRELDYRSVRTFMHSIEDGSILERARE